MTELEMKTVGARARQTVPEWQVPSVVAGLTAVGNYRLPDLAHDLLRSRCCFEQNEDVWSAIISEADVTAGDEIELQGFWLTEWLPLRPGLYHTPGAAESREGALADSQIFATDDRAPPALRDWLNLSGAGRRDFSRLFNPHGKLSMINGGIGCVRLKPLPNRSSHQWLFSASSSGIVHEGVPVAIDDRLRRRLFRDIRRGGALCCDIRGALRFVPRDEPLERMWGANIPQIYLEVSDLKPTALASEEHVPIEVTAVATFMSRRKDMRGLNATYVTFDARSPDTLAEAADWIERVYVREAYDGHLVTDFDEQMRRFSRATFSLERLLNGLVMIDEMEAELAPACTDLSHLATLLKERQIFGDVYIAENVGAIGPGAIATNVTIVAGRKGRRNE
ncbi:hypothetical protein GOL41_26950 [Sinorhizobium medicae]|nr:hypothetical protein [Sinorhizobium meliloti]MDX0351614.1 hypothetical protein [Sinorhizobium meliloti]MDX1053354.1 hypothetical protein [Sinorhizobium medicae]